PGPIELAQRVGAGRGDRDLEPLPAQHVGQRFGERLLVLYHEHPGHAVPLLSAVTPAGCRRGAGESPGRGPGPGTAAGRRSVNVEPDPSTLHTLTSPPWLLAM